MLNQSSIRINHLKSVAKAKRYLEVGVAKGVTFFDIDIEEKTAVDPKFRFPFAELQTDKIKYFQMTSDDWFKEQSVDKKYDIIFLDGLHEFNQTFRDFCASIPLSHPKTIWLIDDTVPIDIYSAWPNQTEAVNLRRSTGSRSGQWHGDVYKTVFTIHDFFPTFNFCTLTEGNPQTLVWQEVRSNFAPLYNSLEAISRMTYFDFVKHKDLMNQKGDEDALKQVLTALNF